MVVQGDWWRPLMVLRAIVLTFIVLAFGTPVFNGVRSLVQVDVRHLAEPEFVSLPWWLPVLFSFGPLVILCWTWSRPSIASELHRSIVLPAILMPVFATMYRGWWALPVGGVTLVLLAGRSIARRRQYQAAAARAAVERAERRADRARRQRERESRGASGPPPQGPGGPGPLGGSERGAHDERQYGTARQGMLRTEGHLMDGTTVDLDVDYDPNVLIGVPREYPVEDFENAQDWADEMVEVTCPFSCVMTSRRCLPSTEGTPWRSGGMV